MPTNRVVVGGLEQLHILGANWVEMSDNFTTSKDVPCALTMSRMFPSRTKRLSPASRGEKLMGYCVDNQSSTGQQKGLVD